MPKPDQATKARMLRALARTLDLGRAGKDVPGFDRSQWTAVLDEAAGFFAPPSREVSGAAKEDPGQAEAKAAGKEARSGGSAGARPVLFTDGASRGNPGPAAAGAVVILGQDQVGSLSRALGVKTNNQAEYEALILGLELVRELGFDQVSIRADSQLMVRQIQGRYKVKDPKLKPLFGQALAALKEFVGYDINHIDRGLNRIADGLANQALDGG